MKAALEKMYGFPIIAAAKDERQLRLALDSDSQIIFLLFGDICSIENLVQQVKNEKKTVIVHIDLVDGLSSREIAVRFIRQHTAADGIISTKSNLIKEARALGLLTVRRIFLLDSLALETASKTLAQQPADFVEILPGTMPKMIRKVTASTKTPIIAGGMISDKEDVIGALSAGATAISTSNPALWRAD